MENNKIQLSTLSIDLRLGRYDYLINNKDDVKISFTSIGVDILGNEKKIEIIFNHFIEMNLFNFNYWEQNYGSSIIKTPFNYYVSDTFDFNEQEYLNYWRNNHVCVDSGFFHVENSNWYEKREMYRNMKDKNYYHYLLIGYDHYIEILAQEDMTITID